MPTRKPRLVALVLFIACWLAGCSSGSGAPQATGQPGQPNASEQAVIKKKEADAAGQPPATTRETFMRLLDKRFRGTVWPKKYPMTEEKIWSFYSQGPLDFIFSDDEARSAVGIWGACAWSLQLIDDVKAARPLDSDMKNLTIVGQNVGGETNDVIIIKELKEATLNDITTAQQFVMANDCATGFKS